MSSLYCLRFCVTLFPAVKFHQLWLLTSVIIFLSHVRKETWMSDFLDVFSSQREVRWPIRSYTQARALIYLRGVPLSYRLENFRFRHYQSWYLITRNFKHYETIGRELETKKFQQNSRKPTKEVSSTFYCLHFNVLGNVHNLSRFGCGYVRS